MHFIRQGVRYSSNLINIRRNEWRRFLFIFIIYFALLTGKRWGEPIVEGAFLEQVGVTFLPYVFIINAILSILASVVYSAFADRVDNTRLLVALFLLSVFGIIVSVLLLVFGFAVIAFALLFFVLNVLLLDVYNVHWSIYVNGFYDTQSAKRIIPVLASGARFAGIFAGFTLPILNTYLSPIGIILLWLGTLIFATFVAWLMPRILHDKAKESEQNEAISAIKDSTYVENIREGFTYIINSPFLRWMAYSALVVFLLFPLLNYQTFEILQDQLQTTENISNFLGRLTAIGNLIALPVQLFVLNRIIRRSGLGKASLIFPVGMFITSTLLVAWGSLFSAAWVYFGRSTLRTTFRNPIDNLLYNAVPARMKGRARAFIVGLIVPIGALISGLVLLIPGVTESWVLGALILILACAVLVTAHFVRKSYGQAVITMLQQDDYSWLFTGEVSSFNAYGPETQQFLQAKLESSTRAEDATFIAQLLLRAGGDKAIPVLKDTIQRSDQSWMRIGILAALYAEDRQNEATRQIYFDRLHDVDAGVRQAALLGLERSPKYLNDAIGERVFAVLNDPDVHVRRQALLLFAQIGRLYDYPDAVRNLDALLSSDQPDDRSWGASILGNLEPVRSLDLLVNMLDDSSDSVRLAAVRSLEKQANEKLQPESKKLILVTSEGLLRDAIVHIRMAALNILSILGSIEYCQSIVGMLGDKHIEIRQQATDVLVGFGKGVIPTVLPLLDSPLPYDRQMAVIVLNRIDNKRYDKLIPEELDRVTRDIYRNLFYSQALDELSYYPGVSLLQNILIEENERALAACFELLSAIHPANEVVAVEQSCHSDDAKKRANAGEALEALTSPQIARRLLPLFEPSPNMSLLLEIGETVYNFRPLPASEVIKTLYSAKDNPVLRSVVIYSLGELQQARPDTVDSAAPTSLLDRLIQPISTPPQTDDYLQTDEIENMLRMALEDPDEKIQITAQATLHKLDHPGALSGGHQEDMMLSPIEKVIFLKAIPIFQGLTVQQLESLANICEEQFFAQDERIFDQDDPGGSLYVVISGKVGIELLKRKRYYTRISTLEAYQYFGEMSLFDNSARSASATALQDTLVLRLRREPMMVLARQDPDFSLEIIRVLTERLRETNERVAELTRSQPTALKKLYDTLD